ncbi:MAG: UDP-glucose/GDP-mannose dehydrogenase family protein [Fimbriimonadia bacterium]|nr:UDP-glucose/GDP-mannose dehydrogenase family protein [Fimbriimonadia bacterium]
MNITVIGTGYVGLVTGLVFSDLGNEVICVDIDPEKVRSLLEGRPPFYEPGVEELLQRNLQEERLHATTELESAVRHADVIFITVGTPPRENGEPDLRYVEQVAQEIGRALNGYKIIVTKSTVPVGTGNYVRRIIEDHRQGDHEFDVVSNPEFLREGSAIYDTLYPERIVIGAESQRAALKIVELYAPLERPMLITNLPTAEIIKYASNAFLALKISFVNSISNLCERVGADVTQVAKGMGYDSRIGAQFLQAGLGFGGSCFPKDVKALIYSSQKHGLDTTLLQSILDINEQRAFDFVERMAEKLGGLKGKTVAVLGLSFKANTDDVRDARSIEVIGALMQHGADIRAYDPAAMPNFQRIYPDLTYCRSAYEAAENADAIALVTEWNEFKQLNMERIFKLMRKPFLFDGRNIYDPMRMQKIGFEYYGIGRTVEAPLLQPALHGARG